MRVRKKKRRLFRSFLFLLVIVLSGVAYLFVKNYREYQQVMVLEEKVQKKVSEYGLEGYESVILSMIYTESKGLGDDPMQSSESAYGEAGKMVVAEDSINQGVSYFSDALALSNQEGTDFWSAVQAYNFGLDYIYFVSKNGGENTTALAERYSRERLAPQLGNPTLAHYRYLKLPAVIHNGGYLYRNGGNMFYAETVKWNHKKILLFHELRKLLT